MGVFQFRGSQVPNWGIPTAGALIAHFEIWVWVYSGN